MSIDEMKKDLEQVTQRCPGDSESVPAYLQNDLLPFLETLASEMEEMDDAIESIVHESEDVLHADSGAVFAGIIASGLAIATELAQRAGNDVRLLKIIREFRDLAKQGEGILEEIVLDDAEDDLEEPPGAPSPEGETP